MKKTTIGIIILLIMLMATSQALAQQSGCKWRNNCSIKADLNLTAEQEDALNKLHQNFLDETQSIRNELAAKINKFQTLMDQPSVDKTIALAKQQEIFDLRHKIKAKALSYRIDARAILSSEQLAMLPPGCGLGVSNCQGCSFGKKGCGRHGKGFGKRNNGRNIDGRNINGRNCWM